MRLAPHAHGFPNHVASQLTGVTPKTLENWAIRGFLKPSLSRGRTGPGGERVYSFRDLVAIRVADELRTRGLDVRHLRGVVAYIRSRDDIDIDHDTPRNRTVITDGRSFMEIDCLTRYAEVQQPSEAPKVLLLVPLGEILNQLQREARARCAA